jgi:hypothetical protein
MGANRNAYISVGKPEGKRLLGKLRLRYGDNIKINLRQLELGPDWIDLAQDRGQWQTFVNTIINLRVP